MVLLLLVEFVPMGAGRSWISLKEAVESLVTSIVSEAPKLDFSARTVKVGRVEQQSG
jgi:hypothetical protein